MIVTFGYGRTPLTASVPAETLVVNTPDGPPGRALPGLLADALARPIGKDRLRDRVRAGAKVTIIVSDGTREEPRGAMIAALLDELGVPVEVTLAVANGTHRPGDAARLGLPAGRILNEPGPFRELGVTSRGTRVRLPEHLFGADLVIATGRIRPHYFAGYGAGAKAVFPGLGENDDIRQNHRLKAHPSARLGRVDGNICRLDMEEAAGRLPVETFLLNVIEGPRGPLAAVAGDLVAAHRTGVEACRTLCEVAVPLADVVVTSDGLPVAADLYQASKLLAPAGLCLRSGGVAVLVAECPDGTGPLAIVNEGIYRIGIRHHFPEAHIIYLVSSLAEAVVANTYCRYAPSVEWVLARHPGTVLALPHAANLVPRVA